MQRFCMERSNNRKKEIMITHEKSGFIYLPVLWLHAKFQCLPVGTFLTTFEYLNLFDLYRVASNSFV